MFLKNHSFFVLKKKYFIILIGFLLVMASVVVYFTAIKPAFMPKATHCIVIDAGHGGKDGGAVGDETIESELNLQYALVLEDICKQFGFDVVLTRSDMNGLYNPLAKNKKRSEMEKRKEIIEKSKADLVVSIHMNSFPSSEARGAQVYHAENSALGKELAEKVQTSLFNNIEYSKKTAKSGDFYILNCSQKPSILVECGFVSNPEEEALLQNKEYQHKFCYNLFCGILQFLTFAG